MEINIDFSVTDSAITELKKVIGDNDAVNVVVQSSGCSGTSYALGIVESNAINPIDIVESFGDIKFVIDKQSAMLLDGVVLDWHTDEGKEGFKFLSTKPTGRCCKSGKCSS